MYNLHAVRRSAPLHSLNHPLHISGRSREGVDHEMVTSSLEICTIDSLCVVIRLLESRVLADFRVYSMLLKNIIYIKKTHTNVPVITILLVSFSLYLLISGYISYTERIPLRFFYMYF